MVDLRLNINNIFETTIIMCLPMYVTEFEFHGLVFYCEDWICVLFLLGICSVVIIRILFIAHNVCVCVLHVLFIFAAGHTNMFSVYIVNFSYKSLYVDIIHCQVGSSSWLILKVHLRIMQVCWKCFC